MLTQPEFLTWSKRGVCHTNFKIKTSGFLISILPFLGFLVGVLLLYHSKRIIVHRLGGTGQKGVFLHTWYREVRDLFIILGPSRKCLSQVV